MEQITIALDINDTLLCHGLTQLISQLAEFSLCDDLKTASVILSDNRQEIPDADGFVEYISEGGLAPRHFFRQLIKSARENIAYDLDGDKFYPHLKKIEQADGQTIAMTDLEADLLGFLCRHQNQNCSKEELLKNVWQYHEDVTTHTVETHIYRLRQKYPPLENILSTRDGGYMIYLKGEHD